MVAAQPTVQNLADRTPRQLRELIRAGEWRSPTAGLAPGYTQANVAIVPRDLAYDFLLFCQRNPQPCPLLEVLDAGDGEPRDLAPGADLRTDVPLYRVYRNGELSDETDSLSAYWRDDLVGFLLGCSFTFEHPLLAAGIRLKHWELGCNVPMYVTNRACKPAGCFEGPMVVSMRPIPQSQVVRTVQITSRFPGRARRPGARRRSGGAGHRRPAETRLRRLPAPGSRRGARLLGLRRHAPGGHDADQARHRPHPLAGPHVHHRPPRARPDGLVTGCFENGGRYCLYTVCTGRSLRICSAPQLTTFLN